MQQKPVADARYLFLLPVFPNTGDGTRNSGGVCGFGAKKQRGFLQSACKLYRFSGGLYFENPPAGERS